MQVFKQTNVIFTLLVATTLAVLLWSGITRIADYKNYHSQISKNAVRNVSESIRNFIAERKRLIQVFSNEHQALIKKSALEPENTGFKKNLESEVRKYFPDFFSFTITDENGKPYYDDFDGLIGDLCLSDVKVFATTKNSIPRVHPHHELYHYDLLSLLNINGQKFIFFISFPADEISAYLKSAQAIGHSIILTIMQFENIIEITAVGSRNKTFREDYRLTDRELETLLAKDDVAGTFWTVFDMHSPDLFSDFVKKVLIETAVIVLIVIIISNLFLLLVRKEEKKRKKAEAIKSEFVAVVSHELRTPLTSIGGAIKLIENGVLGPINDNIKSYLNMASANIDRLTNIVNDILDIKKMESGEFKLQRTNINLVDVVEQSVKENSEYANKFEAAFNFIKPEKDFIVYGDKDRLLQVMANLLSNAVKYGAKKDHINIYFKELGKSIRINVEDHGSGIPEINKNKLFEKFTQAHSRENEVVKGTGLGLSIVKNIIESHDGMVSYEVSSKQGTVFYIILPLVL